VAGTQYNTGDGVISGLKFFRALIANLSSSANSPTIDPIITWQQVADLSTIGLTIVHSAEAATDGTVGAPGIGFASQVLGFFKQAANVIGLSIAGVQSFLFSAAGITLPADPTLALHAATKQYVDAQIAAAVAPAIAAATQGDIGVVKWFPATALPLNHVLCYGQPLARTLPLFTVFGTTYGAGDGSSTFNNIDMRGITPAGVDNMGGTAAGRLTSESISGGASTVGNVGGEETHLLLATELAAHAHLTSDPGHTHPITDPGHQHSLSAPASTNGGASGAIQFSNPPLSTSTATAPTGISVNSHVTGLTIQPTAAGVAHNNVQPTRVGNWIVRVQ
jgi:microcystin-dependent protein